LLRLLSVIGGRADRLIVHVNRVVVVVNVAAGSVVVVNRSAPATGEPTAQERGRRPRPPAVGVPMVVVPITAMDVRVIVPPAGIVPRMMVGPMIGIAVPVIVPIVAHVIAPIVAMI